MKALLSECIAQKVAPVQKKSTVIFARSAAFCNSGCKTWQWTLSVNYISQPGLKHYVELHSRDTWTVVSAISWTDCTTTFLSKKKYSKWFMIYSLPMKDFTLASDRILDWCWSQNNQRTGTHKMDRNCTRHWHGKTQFSRFVMMIHHVNHMKVLHCKRWTVK